MKVNERIVLFVPLIYCVKYMASNSVSDGNAMELSAFASVSICFKDIYIVRKGFLKAVPI